MRRFVIFAGSDYYPSGGWGDFRGWFDTQDEAITEAANLSAKWGFDWWQIVDLETGAIIKHSRA